MFDYLFNSLGLKRRIASFIQVVIAFLAASGQPWATPAIQVLTWIAGAFGLVGVTHAAASGTVGKYSSASFSSIIGILLLIAQSVEKLNWLVPILQEIAAIFGAVSLGSAFKPEPTIVEAKRELELKKAKRNNPQQY